LSGRGGMLGETKIGSSGRSKTAHVLSMREKPRFIAQVFLRTSKRFEH
jgi:hypothetical protein